MTGWIFALLLYLLGMVFVHVARVAADRELGQTISPLGALLLLFGWPVIAFWVAASARREAPDA